VPNQLRLDVIPEPDDQIVIQKRRGQATRFDKPGRCRATLDCADALDCYAPDPAVARPVACETRAAPAGSVVRTATWATPSGLRSAWGDAWRIGRMTAAREF
jgi:hypothetical protein